MNWLAHLVLSDASPEFRVGNVLADLLPIGEIRQLSAPFQSGIARHRAIDAFTDRHPIYRRSVARLRPPFRRYGGVIIDIAYDHLLTRAWARHRDESLRQFVDSFFDDVETCRNAIPAGAYSIFQRMRTGRWLMSYHDLDGVRTTLRRISMRLRRPFDLGEASTELEREYEGLLADFEEFFPQIRAHFPHS